jgi:hypothetical protein
MSGTRLFVARFALILLAVLLWIEPSAGRMMYVEVTAPLTKEQAEKYSYLPQIADADARIHDGKYFVVIRLQGKRFCDGSKCITYVVRNCGKEICPYASAVTGPIFALTDTLVERDDMYKDYVELFSSCQDSSRGQMATFLIGPENVTVRKISDAACDR